ncbi:MAG: virginiamycin B lyase family protein, partial [Nitrososphaerales archaeon]
MNRKRGLTVFAAVIMMIILVSVLSYYVFLPSSGTFVYTSNVQASRYTSEYPTQSNETEPQAIGVESNGIIWFTLENSSALGELAPFNGTVHEFRMPVNNSLGTVTWGLVVDSSRNVVWFTDQTTNSIWSFSITGHKFTQYALKTPIAFPWGISLDNRGDVWFTELFGNKIGEITQSGELSEISIPVAGDPEPSGITADSSGRVWFTLPGISSVGSYSNGKFSIQNLTGLVYLPVGISVDNQENIWLTQHGSSLISEFNPATHFFRSFSTSVPLVLGSSLPYFIQMDQRGNFWINEHQGNAMAEFIPSNNTLIEYFVPTRIRAVGNISGMLTMTLSPSGQPWYTELFAGKIGTINTTSPLDLGVKLTNYSSPLTMSDDSQVSLGVKISGSASSQATLREYVGNYTSDFQFSKSG